MNTKINPLLRKAAGALLVTLFLITLVAVSIAGYLSYVEQQTLLGARSQSWNMAVAVSEAGVEEALQLLNTDILTYNTNGNDWSFDGTSTYTSPTRELGNGNSYVVTIDTSSPNSPIIVSKATVTPPTFVRSKSRFFLAASGATLTGNTTITRKVRVKTGRGNLFIAALVAKHKIDLNGNNVRTDSYDSADPTKSTNGKYDPNKVGSKGDVASNDGVQNAISVGNANIYGHVFTGPNGTVSVGSQGYVGPYGVNGSGSGITSGYVSDTANFTFPDTSLPYTSGTGLTSGSNQVVTISGYSTNITSYVGVSTSPGAPPSGYSMGPVTTNSAFTTTSIYPGALPGLTTNIGYTTVATNPGAQPGLTTNYTHYVSSSSYPGAQPGLSSNTVSTTSMTRPSPDPAGLVINTVSTTSKIYPTSGTYVGSVTTQVVSTGPPSGRGTFYTYNLIISYTYPVTTFTYADQFSYTYQINTYTYPAYTYTYSLYQSTATYETNYYNYVLEGNTDYIVSDASALSGKIFVKGPNVRLVMPNGFSMNNYSITIGSDPLHIGAGISIYSGGTSVSVAGNQVINDSGFAGSFIVYCAPTVTSIAFSGNAQFTGVLVAPSADLALNGGGNNILDFSGALLVNSATLNGHFNFHYDEALSRMGANGRFIITQWDEIP